LNESLQTLERSHWPRHGTTTPSSEGPASLFAPTAEPPRLIRETALFLDFDGTLAPIVGRDLWVPAWVVPVLQRLHRRLGGALALVSGRSLATLDHFVRPLRLPATASHGAERRLPDGRIRLHGAELPPMVRDAATALVSDYPGLRLESKRSGLALHYRDQPELKWRCLHALAQALADAGERAGERAGDRGAIAEHWELLRGPGVIEVKHRRDSRARVVSAFMAEAAFAGRTPIFVGDDICDEDGIAAAQAAGGFGVRVGSGQTRARYRLDDPDAVGRWLRSSIQALEAH